MTLHEQLVKEGRLLFRGRSYLPFLSLPFVFLALFEPHKLGMYFNAPIINFWIAFCIFVSISGLIVRALTVGYAPAGTSGRTTDKPEASTLNTTGMYSLVRHPLYLGNFLIVFGIILFIKVWWLAVIIVLAYWLYYERIMLSEEDFLKNEFGDSFKRWAESTPAFFIGFKKWLKPEIPYSFKNVLKREYAGFFVIVASFTVLKVLEDSISARALTLNLRWGAAFIAGLAVLLILRTLKKKTKWLDVEGR